MNLSFTFFEQLGLALLMGSLIGLERERNHEEALPHEFGGIRTMALVSILGFLVYVIFHSTPVVFSLFTGAYLLLLVASYVMSSYQNKNSGATTEIAGFFAYFIGILVGMNETLLATVVSLLVVLILYFKDPLHRFAHRVGKKEFYDTLKFIVVVFVVLPLLPNATFGPLQAFNPYEIWLVVVLVSSLSFFSYLGVRLLGAKNGIGLGGFLGGFVSSTAVAMSTSALSKRNVKTVNPFVFAILIASAAMFIRVLVTISILNPLLTSYLYFPLLMMALTGFSFAAYYWFGRKEFSGDVMKAKDLQIQSPFQLRSALQFGVFFAAMLFIAKFATTYFGDTGIYFTAFISGFLDVDAVSISMAKLSSVGAISLQTAASAVGISAVVNTFSKTGIVFLFGAPQVAWRVFRATTAMIVVGLVCLYFLFSIHGLAFF